MKDLHRWQRGLLLQNKISTCIGHGQTYKVVFSLIFFNLFLTMGFAQSISLSATNQPLLQVIKQLREQTDYAFVFDADLLSKSKPVTVKLTKVPLESALKAVFKNQILDYDIKDKTITLRIKNTGAGENRSKEGKTSPIINAALVGKVVDAGTGAGLEGATVQLDAVTHSVYTDHDGRFELVTGQKLPFTVIVSSVGYETQRLVITASPATIALRPSNVDLDEVVVVGYGTQKRSDLTGAISSISSADVRNTVTASFDNILKGKASGVQVTTTSHQPGGGTSIRVRGNNSVNTGSEPLYVIDGFPVYNDDSGASAGVTAGPRVNALSQLNTADIESIEILKDASATAIYGSRGANGVVIITTKKGKEGKTLLEFGAYYGLQKVRKTIPLLNATEFALLVNDANDSEVYSQDEIASFGEGTNWQDEIFRTAPLQNYNLSVSSGDSKKRYAASINYYDQDGIVINSGFKRLSARFNYEQKVHEKLTFGNNFTFSRSDANQALSATGGGEGGIGPVQAALTFSPILPVYNADGSYVLQNDRGIAMGNPVATALEITNKAFTYRTLGNIFAEYQIVNGLRFRTSVGADISSNRETYYAPRTTLAGFSVNGSGKAGSASSYSWLNENTLSYDNTFGKHAINVLGGFTAQQYERQLVSTAATGFINDLLGANNLASASNIGTPNTNITKWSLLSYIGRLNYGFNNRLLLTATGRIDGSSKFGDNNKYGFFPSAAIAYKFTEEEFIKNLGIFSELKLRASYGRTGNQEIASYQSLASLADLSYVIGDNVVTGFSPGNIPNADLKWETTSQYDVGTEIGLFNGALNLTADLYYKKTNDMLLNTNVPWSSGFSSALRNVGSVENKGLELGLQAKIMDRKLRWTAQANIAFNRNKVLDLGPVTEILTGEINSYLKISDPIVIRPGNPISSFYGYVSDGIFQSTDDIAGGAQPNASPGDRRYKDLDGSGVLDAADRTFIGNADPKFFGGMSHNLSYKNFDLNVFVNWVYGNTILNSTRADLELPTGQKNSGAAVKDRWTSTNPSNTIPRASLTRSFLFSDALLEDGSFLRLGTVTFGYTFRGEQLRTRAFNSLRLYVSALNPWTWTNYTGYDPEVNRSGKDNILRGIDSDAYPSAKTFLFGLNLNF